MEMASTSEAVKEISKQEMFAAAARGQVHAGGAAVVAGQQATAAGFSTQDTVQLSSQGLALAAGAAEQDE
ncbi:hypothetical protein K8I28_09305 [bacterium]|nr:hypothetical protein [bacterium]